MEVQLFLVLKGKKAVRKWSTKWYIADVCSAANPIKVLYIVSSRILIVSNLGTTREQVEIGETLCSALQSGSSIQLFSVISLFILEQSLWLRWEPHMQKKKKKIPMCVLFLLVKYPISQFWALWILFAFPGPSISFAVSCCPSPCLHVVKLGVCMLEDVCLTVLPFPVTVPCHSFCSCP